jgi:ABC-type phosphate transport system ATPase subunit
MYATQLVEGDVEVTPDALKPGDRVRLFNGLQDTETVTSVTRTVGQWARVLYRVQFHDGTVLEAEQSRTLYRADGPAREEEQW